MPLTEEQQGALDDWAAIVSERGTIEDFLDWLSESGVGSYRLAYSRSDVLDKFYDVDRDLLESARRALLADAAG